MGRYIKLDGENIIEHIDSRHQGLNPNDYDAIVSEDILINENGNIKYKYVDGELVELTSGEIESQPINNAKQEMSKFEKVRYHTLTRLAMQEIIDHPIVPQNIKNIAQAKLTQANQSIQDELGL